MGTTLDHFIYPAYRLQTNLGLELRRMYLPGSCFTHRFSLPMTEHSLNHCLISRDHYTANSVRAMTC